MTKDEFIKTAASLGYASKADCESFCVTHPKEEYTERDYEDLFRFFENKKHWSNESHNMVFGGRTTKRYSCGYYD